MVGSLLVTALLLASSSCPESRKEEGCLVIVMVRAWRIHAAVVAGS